MRIKWLILPGIAAIIAGVFFLSPAGSFSSMLNPKEFKTVEVRCTPHEISSTHAYELIKSGSHILLEPHLLFYPYLEMIVKSQNEKGSTREGKAVWSLLEGEMVLNLSSWEKSHGYEDCLLAKADSLEFALLNTLARHGGALSKDDLKGSLKITSKQLDRWTSSCQKKQLVFLAEPYVRLHFDAPKFAQEPFSEGEDPFVTAPTHSETRLKYRYRPKEVIKMAQNAFGAGFLIKRSQIVYLPVYRLTVQNPDGSLLHTYWNASTGQREEAPD